jgi:hypothetical protein
VLSKPLWGSAFVAVNSLCGEVYLCVLKAFVASFDSLAVNSLCGEVYLCVLEAFVASFLGQLAHFTFFESMQVGLGR